MTDAEKCARVIAWLTRHHLYGSGGYPYDHTTHAGKLFVATADHDGASSLDVYDPADLPGWYDEAWVYVVREGETRDDIKWPGDGATDFGLWDEAFNETCPATP